jgi:hypothetical protein
MTIVHDTTGQVEQRDIPITPHYRNNYRLCTVALSRQTMPGQSRACCGTRRMLNDGEVTSLKRKLEYSGLEMTNRYVHLASDQLVAIQERVSPMDELDVKPMRVPKRQ